MRGLMHDVGEKDGSRLFLGVPLGDLFAPAVAAFEAVPKTAPRLGEHTGEILEQLLGFDQEKIKALRAEKVV